MQTRRTIFGALFLAVFCALIGSMLSTASAMTVTPVSCDQLKVQLTMYPVGSFGYQRTMEMYVNQCSAIRPGCTSELDLTLSEKHCKLIGQYGIRYSDASMCTQVKCSDTPEASSSSSSSAPMMQVSSTSSVTGPCPVGDTLTQAALTCKNNNQAYEYSTVNGCKTVRCIQNSGTQTSCPSPATMTQKALACKARGADYESYTDGVCKMIRCTDETVSSHMSCPTDTDVNASIVKCRQQNLSYKIVADNQGCRQVQCAYGASSAMSSGACPTGAQLDAAISVCKNSGMTYTSIPDNNGCRQVTCQGWSSSSVTSSPTTSASSMASMMASASSTSSSSFVFPDVDPLTLQGQAAIDLHNRGIVTGFADGSFGGSLAVNRAQAAKFLLLACRKQSTASYSGKFRDVKNNQWYTSVVETAASLGIISGYGDGNFRPDNAVTRAEFSKMITKACGLQQNLSYSYTDVSAKDWFAPFAGSMQSLNLFPSGLVGLFQPNLQMTRYDVAVAIYQYLKQK